MPNWVLLTCFYLSILALIQALMWLNNAFFAPRWQRNLPSRKPFSELMALGFAIPATLYHHESDGPTAAVGLVGELEGYTVEISSDYFNGWIQSPFYIIRVFFNTDNLSTDELLARRENNLARSKHFRWSNEIKLATTHVDQKLTISRNGSYSLGLILGIAKDLIAEIKKLDLNPVSYSEGVNQWEINQE